jgi:beta-glucosidase
MLVIAMTFLCLANSIVPVRADTPTPSAPAVQPSATQPAPTTRRAPRKPTPEQQAIIDAVNAVPCDQPAVKIDASPWNRDGSVNANFGKPNGRFMFLHQSYLQRGAKGPIGVLFLGDSITEGWNHGSGKLWQNYVDKYNAANFGISGDKTQHVLWRIANGELDGIAPKVVVLMIGTNNIRWPAEDILKGDTRIVEEIHGKLPNAKLLLLAIFPRGFDPADANVKAMRLKIATVNEGLAKLDDGDKTRYLDIGANFLDADGKIPRNIMPDSLHPNQKGYEIWVKAMQPLLDEMLK